MEMARETGFPEPLPGLTRNHLVLFVDDEPRILASVRRLLADEPFEILLTENPGQALRWVSEKDVSLIITDQVMPEMLGTELLEQVLACSPGTRCAVLTAYPEGAKLLQGLNQGLICMIPKPWDDGELKRTIRRLLHHREQGAPVARSS